jgi:hypothetical protein
VPQPLADTLTHLRVGNQTFLINFYQDHRDDFAEWARQHHQLDRATAHELLRSILVEFYNQVADGRLTKLPPDLLTSTAWPISFLKRQQPLHYLLLKPSGGATY